jgi:hypothetical protein
MHLEQMGERKSHRSGHDSDLDTLEKFGFGNVLPGTMVIGEKGQVVTRVIGEGTRRRRAPPWNGSSRDPSVPRRRRSSSDIDGPRKLLKLVDFWSSPAVTRSAGCEAW